MREAAQLEERAQAAYATDPAAAEALLTDYVVRTGQQLTRGWRSLWQRLVGRYRDGFLVTQKEIAPGSRDLTWSVPTEVGYPESWYARIAKETGERYANPWDVPPNALRMSKAEFVTKAQHFLYARHKAASLK